MLLLDENITIDQFQLLEQWKIKVRQIGVDFETKGIKDEQIITTLHQHKGILLLTRDNDFFLKSNCHNNYSIAYFEVKLSETAFFIRKFLSFPLFQYNKQRLGKVFKINQSCIQYWEMNKEEITMIGWK